MAIDIVIVVFLLSLQKKLFVRIFLALWSLQSFCPLFHRWFISWVQPQLDLRILSQFAVCSLFHILFKVFFIFELILRILVIIYHCIISSLILNILYFLIYFYCEFYSIILISSIFPHLLFPQICPISYSETSFFILCFNSSDPVSATYIFFGVFFHWSMVHLSGDTLLKKKNSSSLSKYHFSKFFREDWDLLPK